MGPGTYQEDDCILQRSRPDRKVHRGSRVGEGDPPQEQVLELMLAHLHNKNYII